VARDGATVITNNIEATRLAEEDLPAAGLPVAAYAWHDAADRARVFAEVVSGRRLAADVPLAGIAAEPLPPEFNRLRWTLLPTEIERYRTVCADVTESLQAAARRVQPGQTETSAAGAVAAELMHRGLQPWVLLVGSDERMMRHRHPLPTAKRIEKYFMLATCAERGGLISACSRLAHFGKVPAELQARQRAVCTVDAALIGATRPGRTLGEIFAEGQAAYAAVGYPEEWRLHHQGGSTGYLPREVRASPGDATVALADQAFAWNPTVAGTKCEDTILCRASGPELAAPLADWPTVPVEWKGFAMARPGILER
jgi:Xaa-Pro aminopeptidase